MIEVSGTINKKLIAYIDRVSDYLGLTDFDAYIELEVKKECDAGAGGFAYGDEETVLVEIARYDSAGKVPMKDLMINIAHELVHAQQLVSGRLHDKGMIFRNNEQGQQVLTLKRIFDGVEYIGVPYKDQPWEIEAYGLEETIYEACK